MLGMDRNYCGWLDQGQRKLCDTLGALGDSWAPGVLQESSFHSDTMAGMGPFDFLFASMPCHLFLGLTCRRPSKAGIQATGAQEPSNRSAQMALWSASCHLEGNHGHWDLHIWPRSHPVGEERAGPM